MTFILHGLSSITQTSRTFRDMMRMNAIQSSLQSRPEESRIEHRSTITDFWDVSAHLKRTYDETALDEKENNLDERVMLTRLL